MAPRNRTQLPASASLGQAGEPSSVPESSTIRVDLQDSDQDESPDLDEAIQAQIRNLQQTQDRTDQVLLQVLQQLQTIAQNQGRNTGPELSVRPTIETQTPTPLDTTSNKGVRHSKSVPDPQRLSDGTDPTFEGWRFLVEGKLEDNADHFPTEESKMRYVLGRTEGEAQQHLLPQYSRTAPTRFVSASEMVEHLVSIYTNPNEVRDAQHQYQTLTMKETQTFAEFQTKFLSLAGRAQIPKDNLRADLYDKVLVPLRLGIAPTFHTLASYESLALALRSYDSELRWIRAEQARARLAKTQAQNQPGIFRSYGSVSATSQSKALGNPATPKPETVSWKARSQEPRQSVPPKDRTDVTCFSCGETGHYSPACTKPRKVDIKEIEESFDQEKEEEALLYDDEPGNEDS